MFCQDKNETVKSIFSVDLGKASVQDETKIINFRLKSCTMEQKWTMSVSGRNPRRDTPGAPQMDSSSINKLMEHIKKIKDFQCQSLGVYLQPVVF